MIRIFPGEPPAQLNQTWQKLSHAIERLRRFRYLGYNKLQGDIGLKYRVGYIYIYLSKEKDVSTSYLLSHVLGDQRVLRLNLGEGSHFSRSRWISK